MQNAHLVLDYAFHAQHGATTSTTVDGEGSHGSRGEIAERRCHLDGRCSQQRVEKYQRSEAEGGLNSKMRCKLDS